MHTDLPRPLFNGVLTALPDCRPMPGTACSSRFLSTPPFTSAVCFAEDLGDQGPALRRAVARFTHLTKEKAPLVPESAALIRQGFQLRGELNGIALRRRVAARSAYGADPWWPASQLTFSARYRVCQQQGHMLFSTHQ